MNKDSKENKKHIRLTVEVTYSKYKDLYITREEYETLKDGVSTDVLDGDISDIANHITEKDADEMIDYSVTDLDNDKTIIDWSH